MLAFLAQCVLAAAVGVIVVALAGEGPRNPSALLAWILVGIALAQLPVALLVVSRLTVVKPVRGARRAALSAALMTGVLLAATAWYLSLALAIGQTGLPLFVLLFLTLSGYAVGFLLVGRLARVASAEVLGELVAEGAGEVSEPAQRERT